MRTRISSKAKCVGLAKIERRRHNISSGNKQNAEIFKFVASIIYLLENFATDIQYGTQSYICGTSLL